MIIYHLVKTSHWNIYKDSKYYESETLHEEKFIHASSERQVEATANRYFQGEKEVMLLTIETQKLDAPLKWEFANSVGQDFPHIYGALNMNAVIRIQIIKADESGKFLITFPE